jgi:hypothetical protein
MEDYIGVAGDWHGNKGWARMRILDFADLGITKILHLGDFGVWNGNSGDKYLHRVNHVLNDNNQKIYVTLGNHEDYVRVSRFSPVLEGPDKGWFHERAYPNILYASRGFRWEWSGTSFVSLGGANSIDRAYPHRIENFSWWSGEQISYGDVIRTREGGYADVFLAHDCPEGVPLFGGHKAGKGNWSYEDLEYAEKSRKSLRSAVDRVQPRLFLHGHYHFLADYTTYLEDELGSYYPLHSVGFNKDEEKDNIAILSLPTLQLDFIDYKVRSFRP